MYRARDRVLGRMVAVKVLSLRRSSDPAWLARLRTEAKSLARLLHPSTVRMYDFDMFRFGENPDLPFLVKRLCDRRPVARRRHSRLKSLLPQWPEMVTKLSII